MATGQARGFLRQLDGLLTEGSAAGLTDGQLLERFATRGGPAAEQAFSALVERHGPMVLRVCRGVLGRVHEADAEDAFQAVFLVLVKRARSLWVADSIGPWLHQVALRTASCARGAARRRRRHEAAGTRPAEAIVDRALDENHDDLGRILHEEIGRLPDRFRIPVVLCDLEGQTHEQAARQAGWPVGTIKSRLTRARERLRGRLTRRGVSPTAGVIPALRLDLDAQLPDALIRSTTAAAVRLAATHSLLLAGTTAGVLAQGVLSTMARSIWWKAGTVILAAATVSGAGLVAGQGTPAKVADPTPAQPPAAESKAFPAPAPSAESGPLRITVSGPGMVEGINGSVVKFEVPGEATILSILPEGSAVKKGDKIAELNSPALRDQQVHQEFTVQEAQAAVELASLNRQTAELALQEYKEGIFLQTKASLGREVDIAAAEREVVARRIERTKKGLEEMQRAHGKAGTPTSADIAARINLEDGHDRAELDLRRAEAAIKTVKDKRALLEHFEAPRNIALLKAEVERARVAEQSVKNKFVIENDRRIKLQEQIDKCTLLAPQDGTLVLVGPRNARGADQIAKGVTVRERQILFSVVDVNGPMQVVAKIDEATIHRVKKGQKAEVRIDAYPGKRFAGMVAEVAPLPDPTPIREPKKVYTTIIRLADGQVALRPGMTASVEVLTTIP